MSAKQVRYKELGKLKKKTKYAPHILDDGGETIVFCFERFDGVNSWYKGTKPKHDFTKIADRLKHYETLTFAQLALENNCHENSLDDIIGKAKNRALKLEFDDEDELWSIMALRKERIWGYEYGDRIFVVVWWDPEHLIRPSAKRGT